MKDIWCYDLEILGGNFFCGTFINPFTKEKKVCYKLDGYSYNIDILYPLINDCLLIGYNNTNYDDIILNYIYEWKEVNTKELYALSTTIISQQRTGIPLWKNEDVKGYMNKKVQSLDLMKILAFDKLKVSLKQCAINLRHNLIQDMPVAYDKYIFNEDLNLILSYNENDTLILLRLLDNLKEAINLRFKISSDYKVNVKSASKTYIGKEILNKYYADYTKTLKDDFKFLRSSRAKIFLGNCIQSNIHFKTDVFNKMLDYFKQQTVCSIEDSIDYKILYKEKGYQMGFGGLHSIDRPKIFTSTENEDIIDCDVDSYYPNIIINYKIKPEHCSDEFFRIVKDIVNVRLKAKKSKDKITAETLKITANAIFGLMNFENYWLYDPKAALSITINGQLYLLMLIETLEENGFEVISANTDGVTTIVPKLKRNEYNEICMAWSNNTLFNLSFSKYIRYTRRDINYWCHNLVNCWNPKSKDMAISSEALEIGNVQRLSKSQIC